MRKLKSVDGLSNFRGRILTEEKAQDGRPTLVVCSGTGGQASGANDVVRVIKRYIVERALQGRIALRITGCQGFCEMDPFILVEPGEHLYPKLRMEDVPRVIEAAVGGFVDEGLIYTEKIQKKSYHCQNDIPFFEKQTRTILGNNQLLDPIRIMNYFELGGYSALERILSNPDPEWIVNEVLKSGLRGRGGAGFPTGKKWELARASGAEGEQKYIICNADEGDPGAYMDRSLLEGNPHTIIEGMLIAGIAIGATKGIIYVRSEYPLAIKHTLIALRQARDTGLLGENILDTGIDFDISIVRGAGAFVCGEETALIRSIEGFMGEPRQRPPYPITKGLWGHPTCINNVETLANVPVIIDRGADEYVKVGVPGNTGTKIFSLVGKIKNTGLVEVPFGMKISEVVYDIGGGPSGAAKIKAVQTGGPSGGCIPASMFDLPIDYESLAKAGSMMGSGGMIVIDENTCMVDLARYFMSFLKDESCGKCYTCRKGTQRMYEILDDICSGRGRMEHLDLLEELALVVKDTTMCGLGQSAANPVLTTLRHFRHEYEAHVKDHRCEAFVCGNLVGSPCQSACPLGTEAWRYIAHIAAGEYEEAYRVIREPNPFPSICAKVCHHPCESRCRAGTSGGEAIAIRQLKNFVTEQIDPSVYIPVRELWTDGEVPSVAVIGSGPAGLTAAHMLSLKGCKVTVFESEAEIGGMLYGAIPEYRLPKEVLKKEIDALLNDNITVKCNTAMGRDITIDELFKEGYRSIFIATGAHVSRPLGLADADVTGIYPSIEFLKAFNFKGEQLAKGKVGVVGGGNSAFDAARTALRQEGVEQVTILYRRTRKEMPAFAEEIEAAEQEGIIIKTLVTPTRVISRNGTLTGLECLKNMLGEIDSSGRQRPMPIIGSETVTELDTLIVAIGESPDAEAVKKTGADSLATTNWGTVIADTKTLETNVEGVFAGGDLVTGSNTVVEAIAHGKRVALTIERFLKGDELVQPEPPRLPEVYIEPAELADDEIGDARAEAPHAPIKERICNFSEVEGPLSVAAATREAGRCMRCDLEFTMDKQIEPATEVQAVEEK